MPVEQGFYITYSPRIRGDGPHRRHCAQQRAQFSPYSRGWSPGHPMKPPPQTILPVFAGMVRVMPRPRLTRWNSPRIRGDGPNQEDLQEGAP